MIIVSIVGPAMDEALRQITASRRYADLFELRLDLIRQPDVVALLSASGRPTIAVCRSRKEGGGFQGSEQERMMLLELAVVLGSEYADIELSAGSDVLERFTRRVRRPVVILSSHLARSPGTGVRALFQKMASSGADVLKIAYPANDASDIRHAIDFLTLARKKKVKAIAIAMGESGEASRVLYRKFGGWGTYAAPEGSPGSAPGQLPGSILRKLYKAEQLTESTSVFGVVGYPLGQSKGVFLHNPLFHLAGMDAVYCRFPAKNLSGFMKHIAPHLEGFSVTLPHKREIMGFLDQSDDTASSIGAVNTVLRRNGKMVGTNTDGVGALDAIESILHVRQKRILVLGAGGAARAIVAEAKKRGAEVFVSNRTPKRARDLARDLGAEVVSKKEVGNLHFDILVNATSVGMVPNIQASPVSDRILRGKVVFDAVYNPPMTMLLQQAKNEGATVIQGTEMYMNQAARQSELYTGTRPGIRVMRRLLGGGE